MGSGWGFGNGGKAGGGGNWLPAKEFTEAKLGEREGKEGGSILHTGRKITTRRREKRRAAGTRVVLVHPRKVLEVIPGRREGLENDPIFRKQRVRF